MANTNLIFDVHLHEFDEKVIERSHQFFTQTSVALQGFTGGFSELLAVGDREASPFGTMYSNSSPDC